MSSVGKIMKTTRIRPIALGVMMVLSTTLAHAATPVFEQITIDGGNFNSNATGVYWIDYDNDGYQDLLVVDRSSSKLYRNTNGNFSESTVFDTSLLSNGNPYLAIGDIDNDGYDDIYVVSNNTAGDFVLRNNQGDGTFSPLTGIGLQGVAAGKQSVSLGDVDKDGDLDVFVGSFATPGNTFSGAQNDFYRNTMNTIDGGSGALGFVREDNGLEVNGQSVWSSLMTDYDNDGHLDVLLAHDFDGTPFADAGSQRPNFLRNDGTGNFSPDPREVDSLIGYLMGIAAGDYNRDGFMDYYLSSIPHFEVGVPVVSGGVRSPNLLVQNTLADDISGPLLAFKQDELNVVGTENLLDPEAPTFGWGTAFLDADNDGDLDLYVVNNEQVNFSPNRFYINEGGTAFTENAQQSGLEVDAFSVTLAAADYDNDGRMDMTMIDGSGNVLLLHNVTPADGNDYLKLSLKGSQSDKSAIGARVSLTTSDGITQIQETHSSASQRAANSRVVHFGVPSGASIDGVHISWPSGQEQTLTGLIPGQTLDVTEGIWNFGPPSGPVGTGMGIQGNGFCVNECYTGSSSETQVTINDVPVSPVWVSPTVILLYVPEGATTGRVKITTPNGTITSATDFRVLPAPTISSAGPASGPVGTGIGISGDNLCIDECGVSQSSETQITINGLPLQQVWVNKTVLLSYLPPGATTGPIKVTTPGGTVYPDFDFVVTE